jgi:hypothetical protein
MNKTIFSIFMVTIVIGLSFFQIGCYKDNKETMYPTSCDTSNVTWNKDIKPIITNSCSISGCHNAAAAGGYNLSSYAGVKTMVDNNRFLAVIENGSMPKLSSKLDNCSINLVRIWINKGALEN